MYRVTTPTHIFTLPIQTSSCKEILVSYRSKDVQIDRHYENNTIPSGMTLNGKDVVVRLTQEETKMFKPNNPANVQVRVLTVGNDAYASQVFKVWVNNVLNEEILSDGD